MELGKYLEKFYNNRQIIKSHNLSLNQSITKRRRRRRLPSFLPSNAISCPSAESVPDHLLTRPFPESPHSEEAELLICLRSNLLSLLPDRAEKLGFFSLLSLSLLCSLVAPAMGLKSEDDLAVDDDGGGNSVPCSICLDVITDNGDRSWAKLQCGHQFHLGMTWMMIFGSSSASFLAFFGSSP